MLLKRGVAVNLQSFVKNIILLLQFFCLFFFVNQGKAETNSHHLFVCFLAYAAMNN